MKIRYFKLEPNLSFSALNGNIVNYGKRILYEIASLPLFRTSYRVSVKASMFNS